LVSKLSELSFGGGTFGEGLGSAAYAVFKAVKLLWRREARDQAEVAGCKRAL